MAEHEISPYCSRLRSKKLCFAERPPRSEDDILDGSGRVWCQCTMMALGPDGQLVDPGDCQPTRSCFEPFGARSLAPEP